MHDECWTRPLQGTFGQKRHCINHKIEYMKYSNDAHLSSQTPPLASAANANRPSCSPPMNEGPADKYIHPDRLTEVKWLRATTEK
jgi:hypothetical protein